jgi:hypothetical protein
MKIKYFLLGVLFAFTLMVLGVISFLFGREKFYTNDEIIPASTIREISPSEERISYQEVEEFIIFAVENNEPEILEGFLAEEVLFRIEGTDCCGVQSKRGALEKLDFLEDSSGAWNFDSEIEIIKSLEASYPEHYSQAVIGISSDLYSAAFQLNKDNQIIKISLSNSHKLLLQQEIP